MNTSEETINSRCLVGDYSSPWRRRSPGVFHNIITRNVHPQLLTIISSPEMSRWPKNLTIKVYLKEVDYTTMTGFEPLDGSTKVFEGEINFNCTQYQDLAINFSTPFPYSGRNLLVCIEHPVISDIVIIFFNGTSVKGAACSGHTATIYDFIPRTEIYYTAGSAPVYSKPTVTLNKMTAVHFQYHGPL